MKLSKVPLNVAIAARQEYITPCKTLENVRIGYMESISSATATGNSFGEFWFDISFPMETFKEITQVR
jgi:hypothetical protein